MEQISTICGMCNNLACGLQIETDGRTLLQVSGDKNSLVNKGLICPQARAVLELQHSDERLKNPLKKSKAGWLSISWDQALDEIAAKFSAICRQHGGQSIALYQGHAVLSLIRQGWSQRFLSLIRSPNMVRNDHICHMPTKMVERCTYGHGLFGNFDPQKVDCLVLWGVDPSTSSVSVMWPRVKSALRNGAKLVVIDPIQNRSSDKATLHLAPRPGSDGALAMGIIRALIKRKAYDLDLVANKVVGFSDLEQQLATCSLSWTARKTGLSEQEINSFVDILASSDPVHLANGNALEHHSNSFQTLRAVAILRALCGGLGKPGGHRFLMPHILADMTLPAPQGLLPLGSDKYPLFSKMQDFVPGDSFLDCLLSQKPYPLKGALLMGGNPMITWPGGDLIKKALGSLELMVAVDTVMTKTSELANYVLPAAAYWEKNMLHARQIMDDQGKQKHNLVLMRKILSSEERRSDWWILSELGRRMGFESYYPWNDDLQSIDALLEPLNLTWQDIGPQGILLDGDQTVDQLDDFPTPSGKIEFWSHLAQSHGQQASLEYIPPVESQESTPELAKEYPLVLTVGGCDIVFPHSQFRYLESLRKNHLELKAKLNPETARLYQIQHGDFIVVETLRGKIRVKVALTENIIPGVVSLKHGWQEANANLLADYKHTDPVLANAALRSGLCKVTVSTDV
jgi:formate dehydrogenase (coenzyme F420) alpha subunit